MPAVVTDESTQLSPEERADLGRLLSQPLHIPDEFKSWFADWFAVNIPNLPISQVFGFKLDRFRYDEVALAQSTSSTAYTDLATPGPQLTLPAGTYLLIFGCGIDPGANDSCFMSPSINGATPSDNDSASQTGTVTAGFDSATVLRSLLVQLPSDQSTIVSKYRVSAGTHSFQERYLYAAKVVDLG